MSGEWLACIDKGLFYTYFFINTTLLMTGKNFIVQALLKWFYVLENVFNLFIMPWKTQVINGSS